VLFRSALLEPASVALEEGLELLGGTVLVWAAIGLRKHLQSTGVWRLSDEIRGLLGLAGVIAASAVPLVITRQWLASTGDLGLHERGDFGAAPAAMLFALAACLCYARGCVVENRRVLYLISAVLLTAVSLELGCNLSAWIGRQSVTSDFVNWWSLCVLTTAGYLLVWTLARKLKRGLGSSRAASA